MFGLFPSSTVAPVDQHHLTLPFHLRDIQVHAHHEEEDVVVDDGMSPFDEDVDVSVHPLPHWTAKAPAFSKEGWYAAGARWADVPKRTFAPPAACRPPRPPTPMPYRGAYGEDEEDTDEEAMSLTPPTPMFVEVIDVQRGGFCLPRMHWRRRHA